MSSNNNSLLKQIALIISIIISVITTVVSAASIKTDIAVMQEQFCYVREYIDENKVKNELFFTDLISQERRLSTLEFLIREKN